jgi:hypothetical protein
MCITYIDKDGREFFVSEPGSYTCFKGSWPYHWSLNDWIEKTLSPKDLTKFNRLVEEICAPALTTKSNTSS